MGSSDRPRQLAYLKARELALRLWAYSTAGFAESWTHFLGEKIVEDAITFSVFARRVNQLFQIDANLIEMVDRTNTYTVPPGEQFEHNYGFALNQLIHSEGLSLHWTEATHRKLFTDGKTYFASSIACNTDKFSQKSIDLQSISSTFMVQIRAQLTPRQKGQLEKF